MKLGIFLLVFGLVLAGAGAVAWTFMDPATASWYAYHGDWYTPQAVNSVGVGMMVFGGGLALGGIVRMIVKR